MDTRVRKFPTVISTEIPNMGDGGIPVEKYTSPEIFAQEKEKIFRHVWLEVGREDHIPNPGDYFVTQMPVLDTEVIVARSQDGSVHAFHNMCTHRGMKLAMQERGNVRNFTCGFHGWVFGLDGELKLMNGEEYFPGADRCQLNARPITLDTWNGFIFVHPDTEPEVPLRTFLGALADQLDPYPFENFSHIARYTAYPKVNWKLATDAFQEAYHVEMVHRNSLPGSCNAQENPNGAPTSARLLTPHRSISAWMNPAFQPSKTGLQAFKYGLSFEAADVKLPGINPDQDENWWFDINVFFPNFFCDVGPGYYFTYNFWPISVNETKWVMDIYQLDARNAGERFGQEHTKVLLRDAVLEDFGTLEATQEMLASGAMQEIQLSELEIACRHQVWVVDQWLANR